MRPGKLTLFASASVLAALAAAGCGSSTGTSRGTAGGGAEAPPLTAAPAGELDTLRWNLFYEPASLDPVKGNNYAENEVGANLCESLLRIGAEGRIAPALASAVRNPDPRTWVYTIRSDVRFWNGRPLTADDVVASLRRNVDPRIGSYYAYAYRSVRSIDRTGPAEVTVRLSRPDLVFNEEMATAAGAIGERGAIAAGGRAYGTPRGGVMCTGPFRFASWESGKQLTIERNDDYWDAGGRAKARRVVFSFVADDSTATNALSTGAVDGQYEAPVGGVAELQRSTAGRLYVGESSVVVALTKLASDGPLADLRVRKALSLAIDRAGVADAVFHGTATPARSLLAPATWGYERDWFEDAYERLPSVERDLDAARRLVEEAGSPRETITIATVAGYQFFPQVAAAVQDAARQIGLDVRLLSVPVARYQQITFDPKARAGVDAFFTIYYADVPDPLQLLSLVALPGNQYNYDGYDVPEVTRALNAALAATDPARRARLVTRAQERFTRDATWIPIVNTGERLFMSTRVSGAPTSLSAYLSTPWAARIGSAG